MVWSNRCHAFSWSRISCPIKTESLNHCAQCINGAIKGRLGRDGCISCEIYRFVVGSSRNHTPRRTCRLPDARSTVFVPIFNSPNSVQAQLDSNKTIWCIVSAARKWTSWYESNPRSLFSISHSLPSDNFKQIISFFSPFPRSVKKSTLQRLNSSAERKKK